MTDLAEQYHVSIITIRATFKLLQELGIIRVSRGREAIVTYDITIAESKQKYLNWLASRLYTMSEVFILNARIAASYSKYGATFCGANEVAAITEMASRALLPQSSVNVVTFYLMELYLFLVGNTKNEMLLKLIRSCDEYLSIAMLLVSQDRELNARFDSDQRQFLLTLCDDIAAQRYEKIKQEVYDYAMSTGAMLNNYISKLTDGYEHRKEILLRWTVSGTENLYSEIAHDLILRISTGEFLDGDLLPFETQLKNQYSTSSKTIRSALVALNDWNIVKTVNGVGTTVTYLTPSVPPDQYKPDQSEIFLFFCSLQAVMLNAPDMLRDAFLDLSEYDIETTETRVNRVLDAPDKCFYSYVGILLHVAVQNCKHELMKQVFQQFHTHIFLLSHKRKYHSDIFLAHLDLSMPCILDALKDLRNRNAQGYIDNVKQLLSLVAKSTKLACEKNKLVTEIEIPY